MEGETVIWTNVHIMCLLEVPEKDFEMNVIRNYGEWKNERLKSVGMKPQNCLPGISAQYFQYL